VRPAAVDAAAAAVSAASAVDLQLTEDVLRSFSAAAAAAGTAARAPARDLSVQL